MVSEISNRELSALVGRIYDCVLEPAGWEQTLTELRDFMGAETCALALLDTQNMQMKFQHWIGSSPEWIERQAQHYPEINAFVDHHLDNGLSLDEPLVVSRLMSEQQMLDSPYWSTHVRRQQLIDIAQINILRTPTRLAMLGIGRHEKRGFFGDADIEMMRLLVPHVRRAVTISNVLDVQTIEKARIAEALDALSVGVLLTNEDGNVLHANASAKNFMSREGALRMTPSGTLAATGAAAAEIRAAVKVAARNEAELGGGGLAVRLTSEDQAPIVAHVLPLSGTNIRSRLRPSAAAAIIIGSAADEARCAQTVSRTFGLTAAEQRVLGRILAGKNVVETASSLGIAPTTARSHLNSIFAKTSVSRQSDLIRLALQITPVRQADGR